MKLWKLNFQNFSLVFKKKKQCITQATKYGKKLEDAVK